MSRILLLLILVITALSSQIVSSHPLNYKSGLIVQSERVHNLDTGLNYTSIQEAIDAPETWNGHRIFVEEGIYYENLVIDKSLSIIGENKNATIIDGSGVGDVTTLIASNIIITGFTFQNSGDNYLDCGISIDDKSTRDNISHNLILGNNYGLAVLSSNNTFYGNIIKNNFAGLVLNWGEGNTLRNNVLLNNTYGFRSMPVDNDVDISNTVDGKPIYYWVNRKNESIPSEAGVVVLVNCFEIVVQGLDLDSGIVLGNTKNSKIEKNNCSGILLLSCSSNCISRNNFKDVSYTGALYLVNSSSNIIYANIITNNYEALCLFGSSNNRIYENSIVNNYRVGELNWIYEGETNPIIPSSNNLFLHNNFINNTGLYSGHGCSNTFDIGYPLGGNYWSDYNGADSDHDGIGDTPYFIKKNNQDNYPLMGMFSSFNTSMGKHVNVISNSTIEDFEYFESNDTIRMYVSSVNATQAFGFCRVCIPHTLMDISNISVIIDDRAVEALYFNDTIYDNTTHRWIYFAYEHSTHKIDIIPEFPSFLILPLLMIATLLAAIIYRRKHSV